MTETPKDLTQETWQGRYSQNVLNTFGRPQRVLVRGKGPYVWDADGNRYLDLLGGIAVNTLGHAHPALTAAVNDQFTTLGHVSNFFATPAQVSLAERLTELSDAGPEGRVFFTNSGTEAMEVAYKLARKFGGTERPRIVAMEGGFHGRSLGALTLTHKEAYREPFAPLPTGVEHVPFGDENALAAAMGSDVAAVVMEPIQGEAGVVTPPPGFLALARRLADEHGALLIFDEVQTGMGRVGTWMAHQHPNVGDGVKPDVLALAKGLGSGFPMGAVVVMDEGATGVLKPGDHGTTFGGNPMAGAAGLATIETIETEGLLENVTERGEQFRTEIIELQAPRIRGVRGEGLLIGIELDGDYAPKVVTAALDAGFIVNAAAPNVVRLAPPLIITEAQVSEFTAALPNILNNAQN